MQLFNVYYSCAEFLIDCLITVGRVDYSNLLEGLHGWTDSQTDRVIQNAIVTGRGHNKKIKINN